MTVRAMWDECVSDGSVVNETTGSDQNESQTEPEQKEGSSDEDSPVRAESSETETSTGGAGASPAAPDQLEAAKKWKAGDWKTWMENVKEEITNPIWESAAVLTAWYDERVAPIVKMNLDKSRNEGWHVKDQFEKRVKAMEGEADG